MDGRVHVAGQDDLRQNGRPKSTQPASQQGKQDGITYLKAKSNREAKLLSRDGFRVNDGGCIGRESTDMARAEVVEWLGTAGNGA